MKSQREKLVEAEINAAALFAEAEKRELIIPGKSEKQLNNELFALALEMFGIKKYWHKRIVRSGPNTLKPYEENPPNLILQKDDILFVDFGPIFDEWEADFGRTYVLGNDPVKLKLKRDIETAWQECKAFFNGQQSITGAELYTHCCESAQQYGWEFGGPIAGHLIGHFPHERLETEIKTNYVHPENHQDMREPDKEGNMRDWILEIHFVDSRKQIGGFFEQLLT
ncbi:aminopeptidase P family protein [Cryomorpha ignava]|uniref:Aminopeptidase P family protein n=1 Tax=Cryomorpha ignava TaxID=101383 RepID=A0A7K3WQG3_9FLAO|nr:M24 family metallopeptidase [Cryomorpha ignava]NEN23900.1 aminopeptidase P family protein [Cryomorpha ignava]